MRRLASIALLALALVLPATAHGRPRLAGVFDLSGTPGQIARGPDGNIWVTISGSGDMSTIARIRPNGTVTEYSPTLLVNPVGLGGGPDGNLWTTRNNGVVRVPPGDPDSAQDFDIDAIGDPRRIISGPRVSLWTASADQLVSFPPSAPLGFDATTIAGMSARGIANSGGKLWIADNSGRIVRANPSGGVKLYDVGGGPQEVARGPRRSVAYTNPGTDPQTVGRILPGKNPRKTRVPGTDPFGITFAADRKWWIANFASHDLTILNQKGKVRRFRRLPDNSGPRYVTRGPRRTVWVSLEASQQVAKISGVRPKRRR
jgi:streptogramin lyase